MTGVSITTKVCDSGGVPGVPHRRPGQVRLPQLTVRRWRTGDAPALDRAVSESLEHLRPWMPWAAHEPLSVAQRRALLRRWRQSWRLGTDFGFGMFSGETLVGACGLHTRVGPQSLEMGYWVHVDHVGQGIATRAAAGVTTLAFHWGTRAVEIHHDEANEASRRVPEKLGYTLIGRQGDAISAPGETGTSLVWRMVRGDWRDPFGWRVG